MNELRYNPDAGKPKTLYQREYLNYLNGIHCDRADDRNSGIRVGRMRHGAGFDGLAATDGQLRDIVFNAGSREIAERKMGKRLDSLRRNEASFAVTYFRQEVGLLNGDLDIEDVRPTWTPPPLPPSAMRPLSEVMQSWL